MSEQTITISTDAPEQPAMDYELLREEGIAHLQYLAGKIWTDYNTHDPGLTTLEQLCYALTDLSYRTGYDMKDLLATEAHDPYRCLYTPAQILTTLPVTAEDLRKILVDIEGVQNAWIEARTHPDDYFYYDKNHDVLTFEQLNDKALETKGFYEVLIQPDKEADVSEEDVRVQVTDCLQKDRKLCEDFRQVTYLDAQRVHIKATIEIGEVADADLLMAQIYRTTADYVAPYIRFYTLSQMLDKGKRMDEVMEGPLLQHGFIDTEEIRQLTKRKDLRISDIIHRIMQLEGVNIIKTISIFDHDATDEDGKYVDWVLNLDPYKAPDFYAEKAEVILMRGDKEVLVNEENVLQYYQKMKLAYMYPLLPEQSKDIVLASSNDRHIKTYTPFQNDFPTTYGISKAGLASKDPQRIAQAKQLKAYLLFFEQLLANYFSQIAHFKDLVDFFNPEIKTYFAQTLSDLPGLEEIIKDPNHYENWLKSIAEDTDTDTGIDRKNRFMDHLMARFSEQFTDYSLIMYGATGNALYAAPEKQIFDKQVFLQEYPQNSAERCNAFNHTLPPAGNTDNISGLEKRIANLLGIRNYQRRRLTGQLEGTTPDNTRVQIEVIYDNITNRNIYHLLESGLLAEHYKWLNNKIEIVKDVSIESRNSESQLQFTDPNVLAITKASYDTEEKFEEARQQLIAQWQQWNSDVEGFYMVEHALLCPQTAQQGGVFLTFTSEITGTEKSKVGYGIRCTSPGHNLSTGESIEISHASDAIYNGIYEVYNIQKDHFEIAHANTDTRFDHALWKRTRIYREPYTLQLSFVFPEWPARFRNPNFRELIQQTLREETPAHIQVYVHWFSRFIDLPDATWSIEDIEAYMTQLGIPYNQAETQEELLNKIPEVTVMEQWENAYFHWLHKKAQQTGTPNQNWLEKDIQDFMDIYGISYQSDEKRTVLCKKIANHIQNMQKWQLLYQSGTPNTDWTEKDLKTYMDIPGIPYSTEETRKTLVKAIRHFEQHYRKWQVIRQYDTSLDGTASAETLQAGMQLLGVPYSEKTPKATLLKQLKSVREKSSQWLSQTELPNDQWTDTQLKKRMNTHGIGYTGKDGKTELQQKIMRHDRACRLQKLLLGSAPPCKEWSKTDLKTYMNSLGISFDNADTAEDHLHQIEQAHTRFQKRSLLEGNSGQEVARNKHSLLKRELQQFADEFGVFYKNSDTKAQLAHRIQDFERSVDKWLQPDTNHVQYHANQLIAYLKMGIIPPPYNFDEAHTVWFGEEQGSPAVPQYANMADFDLIDTGERTALGIKAVQTIEMWIKPGEIGDEQVLYKKVTESNTEEKMVLQANGKPKYSYGSSELEGEEEVSTDSWTHIAIVRNEKNNTSLYINGEAIKRNDIVITPEETVKYTLGADETASEPYKGKIAEVRIWHEAKTSEDLKTGMYNTLTGSESNLQSYWKLNESLGNIALDSTSHANHGVYAHALSEPFIKTNLTVTPSSSSIDYNQRVTITINDTQPNVSYQLRKEKDNAHVGAPEFGTSRDLTFITERLEVSTEFNILARYHIDHPLDGMGAESARIGNPIPINVNPKTDVQVSPLKITIDYSRTASVSLTGSQDNVSYQLHLYEGGSAGTPTGSAVDGDSSGTITLKSYLLQENVQLCIKATNKPT